MTLWMITAYTMTKQGSFKMTNKEKRAYLLMERNEYLNRMQQTNDQFEWGYLKDCLTDIDLALDELDETGGF